jgi:hypothetical protein
MLAIYLPASLLFAPKVSAAPYLANRSLKISSSQPNASGVNYQYSFDVPNIASLGSIKLSLCSNSPLPEVSCSGFSGAGLSTVSSISQVGTSSFAVLGAPSQTEIILSRPVTAQASNSISIILSNVTNPTIAGSYYGRIELYSTVDATGGASFVGGLAIAIQDSVGITTEVPPYLYFCVGVEISGTDCNSPVNYFYDFGTLNSSTTKFGKSQFLAATNAGSGYNVRYSGNVLTSGNKVINSIGVLSSSQKGQSQFGFNLRRNSGISYGEDPIGIAPMPIVSNSYNVANKYTFNSGDILVSINEPSYFTKFTSTFIVNVLPNQPPGVYSTTITYICLANF